MVIINFFLSAYRQSSIYPMNCSTISTVLFRIFLTHQHFEIEAQVFDFIGLKKTYILQYLYLFWLSFCFIFKVLQNFSLEEEEGGGRMVSSSGYVGRRATWIRWESILREVVRLQYYQKNGDFGAKNRFLFLSWKWREIGLRCVKKYCGNTQFTLITSEYQNSVFES